MIMCDHASRYLSKVFDDDLDAGERLLGDNFGDATVRDLLGNRIRGVISTTLGTEVKDVIARMKKDGISQLPVLDDGRVVGIVNESDVLNHLLQDGNGDDTHRRACGHRVRDCGAVEPHRTHRQFFKQNKIVIVLDGGRLVGIITKIDFIDFVSRRMT